MASSGKRKTTMAKLTRERRLQERRLEKKARKDARRRDAERSDDERGDLGTAGAEHADADEPRHGDEQVSVNDQNRA